MLKFFLILAMIYLIFQVITYRYRNVYPSVLYFGLKGSGKSTWLTKEALRYLRQGRTVYSNFKIPGCILYDPRRLGEFKPEPESVIICDEIGLIFNNRHWDSFPDSVNKLLKLERKYSFVFISATQMFDEMDKKIRGLYDHIYQVTNVAYVFCLRREIIKKQQPTEDGSDIRSTYRYAPVTTFRVAYVPRYIEYFDSFEAPWLPSLEMETLPITETQIRHLSSAKWFRDEIRIVLLNLIHRIVIRMRENKQKLLLLPAMARNRIRSSFQRKKRRNHVFRSKKRFQPPQ